MPTADDHATDRAAKELRLLRGYAITATAVLGILALTAFQTARRGPGGDARFTTLTVERINVVERDGTVRLVISNQGRSPGQVMRGRRLRPDGQRWGGMIFYDERGSENGGLTFGGRREDGRVTAGGNLTFDQFEQDQVVALQHIDEGRQRFQGLTINDRPDEPLDELTERDRTIAAMPAGPTRGAARAAWVARQGGTSYGVRRLFAGRGRDKAAVVNMADPAGRVRLRLRVDSSGAAAVEFLDDTGRVTHRLPDGVRPAPAPVERP